MMSNLIAIIANDINIHPYDSEQNEQYLNRLVYSALSFWILSLSNSKNGEIQGISKKLQTSIVQDIQSKYLNQFKLNTAYFKDDDNKKESYFINFVRNIYRETGYLLANNNKYCELLNNGASISFENENLYFGIPNGKKRMYGLGIYTNGNKGTNDLFEMMIRDCIHPNEYIKIKYNILDFNQREIDLDDYEKFNPMLKKSPSQSWGRDLITKESIIRNRKTQTYLRVINDNGTFYYADEEFNVNNKRLIANETRRLYIALKYKYGYPVIAFIKRLDKNYSHLKISAHLPNREYYFLLLMAWPYRNSFDKREFIVPNQTLSKIEKVLKNIGINIRRKQ